MSQARTTAHLDMTSVDEEIEKMEQRKAQKKNQAGAKDIPQPTPSIQPISAEPARRSFPVVKHDFPNPLNLSLTECGLPAEMVTDRLKLIAYVRLHVKDVDLMKMKATENEMGYYEKYRRIAGARPVSSRDFAVSLRLIAAGLATEPPKVAEIVLNGL